MDSSHDRRTDDHDGARTVSNWELMMLSQEMKHKLEDISTQIARMETSNAKQFGEIQTWQGEYQTKVDTNSGEIVRLREHHHQTGQRVQVLLADSVLLPTESRRETVRLLPWVQMASRHLDEEKIIRLDNDLKRKEQREVRWFGLSREFVIGAIALVSLFLATHSDAIWHALTGL